MLTDESKDVSQARNFISSEEMNHATNSAPEVQEIQLDDIITLRDKLKMLDSNWAEMLAELMESDITKVYNIVYNKVQHNKWRVVFVIKGKELLGKLLEKQNEALTAVSEINSKS